ncbi:putative tyrosyl-trna mitochondrial precursor protein [Botrytis fragariae]|uniref:Tyrosine--tRNA ligase n=1 Tax=Botrytis fragariae TaxID=1964551 RepID=A0A8H6AIZ4_9HELO|nr:putative tyrosyl-trna mitochondrial precursor protein [Botrytis fragariae]KAF5868175.1 putative tyrosyl-trna mitochondrial precursor protein [Botrytis fragariae]
MATTSLLRYSARPDPYVCARCAFRASRNSNKASRRWIGMKYLAKAADAQVAWAKNAAEIKTGKKKSMLSILEERGYVHQITGSRDELDRAMTENRLGAYVGVDPTAPSLHVGHLLPFMSLFWMYIHGYHTVSLVGGATAKIGDPTDRLTTREKMKSTTRNENILKMHYQLKGIWLNVEAYGRKYGYQWEWAWRRGLVNNHHWMNKLTVMELLQILGPGMRIGAMIAKDTVKNKMNNGDGMSYSEFSYPLLQSWDWWHMYNTKGITMQIGGSDQYGNITAGIDAVKYILANHPDPVVQEQHRKAVPPLGFTVPLLTTSSGAKFGKSAGNALWLDKDMMSSFDLYAYFLRTSDQDVERYLKLFTFMPIEQINKIMEEHMKEPHTRKAQHALARDFLELIHGVPDAKAAELKHRLLFSKSSTSANVEELQRDLESVEGTLTSSETSTGNINASNRPKADLKLPRSFVMTRSIARIVVAAGLCATASEANRLCGASGLYVGGSRPLGYVGKDDALVFTPIKTWKNSDTHHYIIDGSMLVLRRGKSNIRIIKIVPDEEYIAEGLSFPGNEDWIKQKMPKTLNEEGEIIEEEKNPNILSTGVDISDREEIRRLRRERSHEKSQQRWQDREPRRLERMQLLQADLRETNQLSSEKIDLDKLVKRVKSDVSVDKDRLVRKIDFDERSKWEDSHEEDESKS